MTHFDTYHVVRLTVQSSDTTLLDELEAELPDADAPEIGPEYDEPNRRTDNQSADEILTGRVTAQTVYADDGTVTHDGATYASTLYDTLTSYDCSETTAHRIMHYESPVGAVTRSEVRDWYEAHPDSQPVDADDEPYVPASWDPAQHTHSEVHK
jgi:hypothetical protein